MRRRKSRSTRVIDSHRSRAAGLAGRTGGTGSSTSRMPARPWRISVSPPKKARSRKPCTTTIAAAPDSAGSQATNPPAASDVSTSKTMPLDNRMDSKRRPSGTTPNTPLGTRTLMTET